MKAMLVSLRNGFGAVARNWGLVLLVLGANLGLALVLAVPLAVQLESDLAHTGASSSMMYGFDYDWWSAWSEEQHGPARTLGPEIFGEGFAFRNLDLLLRGALPAALFPEAGRGGRPELATTGRGEAPSLLDPLILGVGVVYVLLQIFLTGGLLGILRAPRGGWTFRGLVHGAGFYFGRLVRVGVLSLVLVWVVFSLNVPVARWVDEMAREAVSERTALVLGLGRHAALLLALLFVHALASHARVMVVRENRKSAALALLSSLGFCARNALAVAGQYGVVIAGAALLIGLWAWVDAGLDVTGWKSQLAALVAFEAFVAGRIALRLGLLGGQLELQRVRSETPPTIAESAT